MFPCPAGKLAEAPQMALARITSNGNEELSFRDPLFKIKLEQANRGGALIRQWLDHYTAKRKVVSPKLVSWVEKPD
jgi:hypothetical protein